MKKIIFALLLAGIAAAQVSTVPNTDFPTFRTNLNTSLQYLDAKHAYSNGAPSGSCTPGKISVRTDNAATATSILSVCGNAGTWVNVGTIPVATVFGRTGAIVAATGDYTAAQVTNAVDQTGSYSNPSWITGLAWTKLTGIPTSFTPAAHAATHQYGGADLVGTATPGANAIPMAGSGGKLAQGWIDFTGYQTTLPAASGSQNGYITSADWTAFNAKQAALGYTPLNAASNLSDLTNAATARTNLGLGSVATKNVQGTGTVLATMSGTINTDDCLKKDASGNIVSAGAPCGGSGGSVAGSDGQVIMNIGGAYAGRNPGTGLTFDGISLSVNQSFVGMLGNSNSWSQPNTFANGHIVSGGSSYTDHSAAGYTAPFRIVATDPPTCQANKELWINTTDNSLNRCNSTGDGETKLGSLTLTRAIGYSFNGSGTALTAGLTGYLTVPYACTLQGWNISADTGTATVKVWRKATGTAIPTVSDSINTSGVSLSTGTSVHSTTLTDFTSTAIAANDILAVNLSAVAGSTTFVNFTLECRQ